MKLWLSLLQAEDWHNLHPWVGGWPPTPPDPRHNQANPLCTSSRHSHPPPQPTQVARAASELEVTVSTYKSHQDLEQQLEAARAYLKEEAAADPDMAGVWAVVS
jgi:hypothetical protein